MYLGEMHAYGTHKSLKSFAHILYINHGTTFFGSRFQAKMDSRRKRIRLTPPDSPYRGKVPPQGLVTPRRG
jgi:hypothetical protein